MIDVGQGDSILIHSNKESVLIDTGGVVSSNSNIAENTIIPTLKSLGIKKLKYLIKSLCQHILSVLELDTILLA